MKALPQEVIYGLIKQNKMESKNLMIGDWVDIREDGKHLKYTKVHNLSESREEEYYFPIPLTEEILKANGFEKITEYQEYLYVVNERYGIKKYPPRWGKGDVWYLTLRMHDIPLFEIDSVHKLQHALRLCGLNELADNFKLK